MTSVINWLRSLGNAGALANASVLLQERRREEWTVAALAMRLPAAPAARAA
jgi:hypothetical protein